MTQDTVPALAILAEEPGAGAFRIAPERPAGGWAILCDGQLWLWATGLKPLQPHEPEAPDTYTAWLAAADGLTRGLGALGPAPGGTALATFRAPGPGAAVLVTAQRQGAPRPTAVVLAGRLQVRAAPGPDPMAAFAAVPPPAAAPAPDSAAPAPDSAAPAPAAQPAAGPPPAPPDLPAAGDPPWAVAPEPDEVPAPWLAATPAPMPDPWPEPAPAAAGQPAAAAGPLATPEPLAAVAGGEHPGSLTAPPAAPPAPDLSPTNLLPPDFLPPDLLPSDRPPAEPAPAAPSATPGPGAPPAADPVPSPPGPVPASPPPPQAPAPRVASPPPGHVAVPAATVQLQPQGAAAGPAGGTAQLDFTRGALLVTLRQLPRPEDLGESPHTGRPYNAYRVWLQSTATREFHPLGVAARVWTDTHRVQVREGLPLRRYDTVLVTAEDRAGTGAQPGGMLLLVGRYRWYEPAN